MARLQDGDRFNALDFTDEVTRGGSWTRVFRLYGGTGGNCGPVVQTGPLDLRAESSITAEAKAGGTNESIDITSEALSLGSDTVPARIRLRVVPREVLRAFSEGATRDFQVTVYSANLLGDRHAIINGHVHVNDSAEGGL